MSFTTSSLLLHESLLIAELYQGCGSWEQVRHRAVSENLLQARTTNSLKRTCSEAISRLKTLTDPEMDYLTCAPSPDRGYLLWVAICRRYPFIRSFAIEVLREGFLSLKRELSSEDYEHFYHHKSTLHPELDTLSPATRQKLRQVLFKMLKEAGLLDGRNRIIPTLPSSSLALLLSDGHPEDLRLFTLSDTQIRGWAA